MSPRQQERCGIRHRPVGERVREGFTLIELLVVIAVIAVLVAVLLPCFNRAREAGRRAACMSNLRQMQTAWQMYADSNGDRIVHGRAWNWGYDPPSKPWLIVGDGSSPYLIVQPRTRTDAETLMRTGALAPYIGNVGAYLCPGRYRPNCMGPGWDWLSPYNIVLSMNVCPPDWADYERKIRASHEIGRTVLFVTKTTELADPGPSSRMVFLDEGGRFPPGFLFADVDGWFGGRLFDITRPLAINHSNGTCLSFADGHSEYWRWTDPSTIALGRQKERWVRMGAPPSGEPYVCPCTLDNADYTRVHRAIWGKGP